MEIQNKILGILCNHENLVNLPFDYKKMLAREITELIVKDWVEKEFARWFRNNSGYKPIDELHDYWKKEVKGK